MGGTPNIAGMVNDPDFQSLAPADKRAALTKVTGDQSFASLNDGETMQFVSRFPKPAALPAENPINAAFSKAQSIGPAPSILDQLRAGQVPGVDQLQQGFQSAGTGQGLPPQQSIMGRIGQFAGLVGKGPAAQATIGSIAPEAAGTAAEATGTTIQKLAGVPEAEAEATAKYQSELASQQEALRQRAIGKRQNVATHEQAKTDLASANAQKKVQYQSDVSDALSKVPAAPPGQQALWVDLNKSVQVPPNAIKVKLGATDLTEAMTMPGRGMAQEGLKAADLSKMTPPEQNAVLAPRWHAAGQKIDALAQQATDAGKTVDIRSVDEAVNNMLDKNDRDGMNRVLTRIGKGIGLRGRDWTNITPTQALAMKRALWEYGENGEYVARAVSNALRDQVPELKAADQQYSDLNGAMTSIRTQYGRYSAGKFTPPEMTPSLPQPPTLQDFQHPSYKTLPKIPQAPTPPDLTALQNELVKNFGIKAAKIVGKYVAPPVAAAAGAYEGVDKLKRR